MKENLYDDETFFSSYSNFPRSVEGLMAAGEWHVLRRMFPPLGGKRVLDIGCGFGWHCAHAAQQGAASVLGTDISERMLQGARERNDLPDVEYRKVAMEEMEFPDSSFDVVISSLAFHYTRDFAGMCRNIFRWLAPGGQFVFSVEHPVFTAEGSQLWLETEAGKIWPVDRYFTEGERRAHFLGSEVVKYHRTLTSYMGALLESGFVITGIEEPVPEKRLLDAVEGMSDELRRPMMLIVSARKPSKTQC